MSDVFEPSRFLYLFRKTVFERPVQLYGIVVLNLVVVLLMYSFLRDIIGWSAAQNLSFLWGLIFGGCYLSSAVFGYFGSNASGSSYLTLPASLLEKWLCGIVITWVLYVFIFLLYYKGVDLVFVSFYHNSLNPLELNYQSKLENVGLFDYGGHVAKMAFLMFGVLTSAMFVGSLYFNKISFVKTGLIVCAVVVFFYAANLGIAKMMFTEVADAFPFSHIAVDLPVKGEVNEFATMVRPRTEEGTVSLPSPYIDIFRVSIRYILPFILCVTALIRLKEKEF